VGLSRFDQAIDELGADGLSALLKTIPVSQFLDPAPEGMEEATAWECLPHLWEDFLARPEQRMPAGDWSVWNYIAGRGTGKTRTGAETTVAIAQQAATWVRTGAIRPEEAKLHLIGATAADVRDVMIRGPAGILRCSPPWFPARYEPSNRRIVWPYGVEALLFSAAEPDRLRGPQGIWAWADELAAWQYIEETWDNLQMGLRLGPNPRTLITTTPRPLKILKDILAEAGSVRTHGQTRDNYRNLSPKALAKLYARYGGTRIGRQELAGEILDDNPRALWHMAAIDARRLLMPQRIILAGWRSPTDGSWDGEEDGASFDRILASVESRALRARKILEAHSAELQRIVIGVDPAVSNNPDSDETGIVVSARGACRCNGIVGGEDHCFTLDDLSGVYSPSEWGRLLVRVFKVWGANKVLAEINQGGALVESNLRAAEGGGDIPYQGVHAKHGKLIRAEPIASLHEQGKIHHVGTLGKLETELTTWDPLDVSAKSPNRLDAKVYAETDLMIGTQPTGYSKPRRQLPGRRI